MVITKQNGFDSFKCIAEQCPESCCKCWQIVCDEDSVKRYHTLAETDARVLKVVNEKDRTFRQNGRVCGFLDPDELCYLQKTYGEEMLCETCSRYPRHMEEFENVREFSLSLSCPHAANTLLNCEDKMSFETYDTDEFEEYDEFDNLFYDKLLDARDVLFQIAQDRTIPLNDRMDKILAFALRFQKLADDDSLFEADGLIQDFISGNPSFSEYPLHRDPDFDKRAFSVLFELEELHDTWKNELDETWQLFFAKDSQMEFQDLFLSFSAVNEKAGEQILMLFLYTYFCGSVYDGWIWSKAMLSVYSVKWIFMIAFSLGAKKNVLVKTAYQYAREIEHSVQNLILLDEWFMDNM